MGKPSGKKKSNSSNAGVGSKSNNNKQTKAKAFDEDMDVFIGMSQELKEEGNKLFQKKDHEGAMLKYEKALKLLPGNHTDVAYLRANMAGCYMQMGIGEYPRAINECNLALQVVPRYSKALLKRAKCFESLNRLDLAFKDVKLVLNTEPNNLVAAEMGERLKVEMEQRGMKVDEKTLDIETSRWRTVKEKMKKKKKGGKGTEEKKVEGKKVEETKVEERKVEEKKVEEKVVVAIGSNVKEEQAARSVKLVFGQDIRWAQLPFNCSIQQLREMVWDKFPCPRDVLIKYKDQEGDFVTISTTEELRWAEASTEPRASIRLYVVDANHEKVPTFEGLNNEVEVQKHMTNYDIVSEDGDAGQGSETMKGSSSGFSYFEEWIFQFAQLFKNHVGFSSDEYLDLHEQGMKYYSDAIEDTITTEEAQDLFENATEKFQEMTALSLFNWGNVHMSRARKKVVFTEDASRETILEQLKTAYEWAKKEYVKAGKKYEEALKMKPDFYEAFLALGQQQFEQAKLSWCYAVGSKVDLETWPSTEVLQLFNNAEDNMEKGMQMWEEIEAKRLVQYSKLVKVKSQLQKSFSDVFKDISRDESAEQSENMRSQINLLWGVILYERSIVEFKLELPVWKECLEVAVEKFELAGTSPTDIAVMIKNHCANQAAVEGLGFKIDEIVQAWNEMYDAKKWQIGAPASRLEPLFRRRVPKLHRILEHV